METLLTASRSAVSASATAFVSTVVSSVARVALSSAMDVDSLSIVQIDVIMP